MMKRFGLVEKFLTILYGNVLWFVFVEKTMKEEPQNFMKY
jgi:hypothetical protein